MCGIIGVAGNVDKKSFKKAVSLLNHRGPDDQGFHFEKNLALGHKRLSIIDLSKKAKQPMFNEDKSIVLVYNGEIYNFKELKMELKQKHKFKSNSDSEVLIHLYEEEGPDFIKRLNGMFAFAIWDKKKDSLLLARDRAGIKPLYYIYYWGNNKFIFSSEIKPMLELGITPEVNEKILYDYFNYQIQIGDETLFKRIFVFPAGNYMIYKDGSFEFTKYWEPEYSEGPEIMGWPFIMSKSFKDILREYLENSVKRQLIADVPVGAFLSGGLDSSAIVALAKKHYKGEFHTFTAGFDIYPEEIRNAEFVAKELGTTQHSITITPEMFVDALPKLIKIYGAPISFASSVPLYYLAEEAKKYVKVVLTGEGADELFAGYHRYYLIQKTIEMHKKLKWMQLPGSHSMAKKLFKDPRYLKNLDFLFNGFNFDYFTGINSIIGDERNSLNEMPSHALRDEVERLFNEKQISFTNRLLYLDFNTYLQELLAKQDRMSMAASIESRVPFLDNEVIDFANSIPSSLKLNGKVGKFILRQAVKDILPKKVLSMKKIGFQVPLEQWFNYDLKEYITKQLSAEWLDKYFSRDYINSLLKKQAKHNCSLQIWAILNFKLWIEEFLW